MPFGDVTKFRAKLFEREENAWVLGCADPFPCSLTLTLTCISFAAPRCVRGSTFIA